MTRLLWLYRELRRGDVDPDDITLREAVEDYVFGVLSLLTLFVTLAFIVAGLPTEGVWK